MFQPLIVELHTSCIQNNVLVFLRRHAKAFCVLYKVRSKVAGGSR
jgi:hypothetical protein